MSNDENTTESVESAETSEQTTETVTETVETEANAAGGNAVSKILELKESNPKVFFGAIGGLVLVVLILMMSGGGSSNKLVKISQVELSVGNTYSLRGVNSTDPSATIRLVAVPGSMAAYDDTEDADRNGDCKHMPEGTKVKLIQVQQAFGKANFVEVEMLGGECAGRKGWVVSNNLK